MALSKVQEAIEFAARAHRGQFREGEVPLPYVVHPVEVLLSLRHVGGVTDEDMLVAAVLHDVVEEGGATLEAVREAFGERAGSLVEELTRREPTADETQGMSGDQIWQLRADMLLEEIRRMSPDAKTVKLADRVSNLMEAARTKRGKKLARYRMQTERILSVIPKDTNPGLWTKLDSIWRDTEGVLRAKKGS